MTADTTAIELVAQPQSSAFLSPAASLAQMRERYTMFGDFVRDVLHKGIDFEVIPGTDKPSLVKPGAEKLAAMFGLTPRFIMVRATEDWTGAEHNGEPFFYYVYRCELFRQDAFIGSCEGSCNSWEKKYRYRAGERKCPTCGKATIIKGKAEYGGGWICFAKKGGCGAKFKEGATEIESQQTGLVPNTDIADQVNTIQKMAQKRAFVGAVLIATNASEYFTQDVEEMAQFAVEADYREETPAPAPVARPQPATEKMWKRWHELTEKADVLGIHYPAMPDDVTAERLTEAGKALASTIREKEAMIASAGEPETYEGEPVQDGLL